MEITRQMALKLARENGVTEPSSSAINRFAQAANDLSKPEIENLNARITELEGEIERLKFVHQVAVTAWEEADAIVNGLTNWPTEQNRSGEQGVYLGE